MSNITLQPALSRTWPPSLGERRLQQSAPPVRTALIIDDDPTIGRLLSIYLREAGFTPVYAPDGVQGLVLAAQHQPSLVLLDVMMPGLSGWEVCRELRQSSSVPIIMLTAKGAEQDVITGMSAGADDYLTKPFSGSQLLLHVESVLRRAGVDGINRANRVNGTTSEPKAKAAEVSKQPQREQTTDSVARPGSQLKQARRDAGLSLYNVERRIGIRWDYVQALECEHLDYIPRHLQRLILTKYARFLGLDPVELWSQMNAHQHYGSGKSRDSMSFALIGIATVALILAVVLIGFALSGVDPFL